MELETLKASWERLDRKMERASLFNEKLVEHIVASKVTTTIDKMKNLYASFYVILSLEIVFFIGVFLGNPFDFKYKIQYVPYGLLLLGVCIAFVNLIILHQAIRKISPKSKVDEYVKNIISIFNQNKKFEKRFGIMFFSAGLLVPLSFLPQKIERLGVADGIKDLAIMISVVVILYALAFKFGAFKNPYKDQLERHLVEWNELQSLANS